MKTIFLTDGTTIGDCIDTSSPNDIFVLRETYAAAGAVRDLFTEENTGAIKIVDDVTGEEMSGGNLKLLPGANLMNSADGILCEIHLRTKSELEIMRDEISELQEAIIGE